MGIFEKSIPRYVYNPVQRQVEPVQDYYVDDIFDPLFNRNVRNALTQKYGNPLLGTAMGYYEGIENALFGQDDKWGILGPGMGILSSFGRSMDKAGDVILGSLTETVKGATGQGFENPLENIFVEDEDYTGKRALASIANSMRGLAGGTTITEEDLDSAWNLPSLGIELATDPSILGGNLTKAAKAPSIVKQLGSADNMLGDVGKFLQQYDDIMAKASIDLTAPGLRPAIKSLIGKLPKLTKTNSATNFTESSRVIREMDTSNPDSVTFAKATQENLRQDQVANLIADTYDALTALDKEILNASGIGDVSTEDLLNLLKGYASEASNVARVTDEMALNWAKDIRDAVRVDIDAYAKMQQAYLDAQGKTTATIADAVTQRDKNYMYALHRAIRIAKGLAANSSRTALPEPTILDLYKSKVKEFDFGKEIPDVADLSRPDFIDFLKTEFFYDIPDLNPKNLEKQIGNSIVQEAASGEWNKHYVDSLDFSPIAWETESFSENEALNKRVKETLLGKAKKTGSAPEPFVKISPSDIGKSNPELLTAANDYAERGVEYAFRKNIGSDFFPEFTDQASFEKAIKSDDFVNGIKQIVINENQQDYVVSRIQLLLTRTLFPPKTLHKKPYTLYNRFNDFQELRKLLNDSSLLDVDRLKSKLYTADAVYGDDAILNRITHPWRQITKRPDDSLTDYLNQLSKDSDGSTTDFGFIRQTYGSELDDMFEAYTIGNLSTHELLYDELTVALEFPDMSPEDYDVFAEAVDAFRKQMHEQRSSALYLTTPSSVHVLKDLQEVLNQYHNDVVMPLRMIESEPYATAKKDGYSLNKRTTPNADGETTSPLEYLGGEDGTPQNKVYAGQSAFKGDADFTKDTVESTEDSLLWVLRDLINSNPEVFQDFDNLSYVYKPLSPYVQFNITKPLGPQGEKTIRRFEQEVLPELKRAIADGQFPLRKKTDAYFNKHYSKLQKLLHNDPSSDDFWEIINFIKRDAGSLSKGIPSTVQNLEYYRLAQEYPELVAKWLPKKYVDKVGIDTAIRELFDKATQTHDASEFVLGKFGDLLLKSTSADRLAIHFDESVLHSPELHTLLQNRRFRQELKKFDPVQAHTRFGDNAFFRRKLAHPFTNTSEAVSKVADAQKAAYRIPKSQTFSAALESAKANLMKETPETVAKFATDPPTAATSAQAPLLDSVSEVVDMKQRGVPEETIKRTVPERVWDWFTKIREAMSVRLVSLGLAKDTDGNIVERATLRTKRNADIIQRGKDMGMPQSTVRDVMKLLTERDGDVLTGAEFFDEIRRTGVIQASFTDRNVANAVYLRLKHNVDVFNAAVKKSPKDADALTIVSRKMSNGNLELKVMFNTKNKKIAKQISKNVKGLRAANFADVTFLNARQLTTDELAFLASDDAKKVVEYLTEVNEMARDQARMLGFTFDEMAVHNKHVRNVDPITANYIANDIYNGIDLDSIDEIGVVLSNLDEFRQLDRGVFGAQLQGRRFRGAYWNYDTKDASLFTNDLEKIAKGSLGDGMFANSNYQSFVDFFVNDNFKIHGVFEDVDDIRKFLYAGGSEGLYAGNLKNIDLCVPKYDSNGRIIGIHRFDQYSDADLAKALANPDTILVPANTIDTLDKVIRKEIRLSNKAYAFLNKHFTIPFKFGVLTNPGFLVGNLNDAYLKQAVSMSEKYGTDVSAELAKVGEASTMYLNLGNSFNAAIDKWKKHMDEAGVELSGAETIPEILAGHGPSRKRLMEYLEGNLKDSKGNAITPILDDSEKGTIMLWTKLQQIQHTSNSLREFDDFAEAFGTSDYDVPRNIVDRILQGSGKYSGRKPSTWGVITNNPVSRAAMNASEFIENTMRGTAILNDLMHAGYSREQIIKILMSDDSVAEIAAAKRLFEVDYANAVNAMYEANFNYERMSDFMEGVGKAMPFPTFFLKNLTYWLELFSKNPQFFDHAITVQESMWQDRDVSNAEIEAEAKGRGAVPIEVPGGLDKASGQKLSKWFKGIFKPSPLQSMFGAFSLINDPVEDLSYRLHPAISGSAQAVNQALPHSPLTTFLGEAKYRPYSTDIYEKNVTQEDEDFNSLEYALHKANPYERAVNTALRTPNKIAEGQAQLSDFLPSIFQPDFGKK